MTDETKRLADRWMDFVREIVVNAFCDRQSWSSEGLAINLREGCVSMQDFHEVEKELGILNTEIPCRDTSDHWRMYYVPENWTFNPKGTDGKDKDDRSPRG